jgi:hypothetical protein
VRRSAKIAVASLLASATILAAADAAAFCRTTTCKSEDGVPCNVDDRGCPVSGNPLRWRRMPLHFRFSARQPGQLIMEEARAAIRAAFYRWTDATCEGRRTALRFLEDEEIFEDKPLEAGARASQPYGIYFRDTGWPYEGKADSTLAQTNNVFLKSSGFIEYADIEINTGTKKFSTKEEPTGIDLQAVMTHEVGHYIGLAHSREAESIMVESYCLQSDNRCEKGKVAARRLSADDLEAVCSVFPPDLPLEDPDAAEERSSCSTTAGIQTSRFLLAVGGVVMAGTLVRRRRSRGSPA